MCWSFNCYNKSLGHLKSFSVSKHKNESTFCHELFHLLVLKIYSNIAMPYNHSILNNPFDSLYNKVKQVKPKYIILYKESIKSIVPFHFQTIWISKTIYQGCIEKYFCVSSAQYNALDIFLLCTSNYCTMVQLCIYETKHAIVVKKPFSFIYR